MSGRLVRLLLVLFVAAAGTGPVRSSDMPETFPVTDGTVHAAVIADNVLYIGGSFTTVNGSTRDNAAAVNLFSGAVTSWNPAPDAAVRALAVSGTGTTVYLGGDFTTVNGSVSRNHLAAVNTDNGSVVSNWDPGASATVRAMAVSPDGRTLYTGGDFTGVGTESRNYIAAIEASTGAVAFWAPQADGAVRALAVSGDGASVYAGGDFAIIGGQVRRQLAELQTVNGKATAWDPAVTGTAVNALSLSDTDLYVGGSFSQIGGQARNNLAMLDTAVDTGMAAAWDPDVDGPVSALAVTDDGLRLYAGGAFGNVNVGGSAAARSNLAGFSTVAATDNVIAWNPDPDAAVRALALWTEEQVLYTGGAFTNVGGQVQQNLAAFLVGAPTTTADPAGGGHAAQVNVTLTCDAPSGAGCDATYYTTDGSEPDTGSTPYSTPIAINTAATLKYFSVDNDGNMEPVNTAVYAIDTAAPTTDVSLPGGLYGADTLELVELTCDDDNLGLGCTTYFTLTVDGSLRGNDPETYDGAFSLADLFPPPGVAPDEVDQLLHLAGTVELRYYSVDDAGNQEPVQTVTYEVDLSAPFVTSSLPDGNHLGPKTITLTCDDGVGSGCAEMYYTTDDSPPSDGTVTDADGNIVPQTTRYTGPFTLSSGAILRVLAVDNAGNKFAEIVGLYSFTLDSGEQRSTVGSMDGLVLGLLALAWWGRVITGRARLQRRGTDNGGQGTVNESAGGRPTI